MFTELSTESCECTVCKERSFHFQGICKGKNYQGDTNVVCCKKGAGRKDKFMTYNKLYSKQPPSFTCNMTDILTSRHWLQTDYNFREFGYDFLQKRVFHRFWINNYPSNRTDSPGCLDLAQYVHKPLLWYVIVIIGLVSSFHRFSLCLSWQTPPTPLPNTVRLALSTYRLDLLSFLGCTTQCVQGYISLVIGLGQPLASFTLFELLETAFDINQLWHACLAWVEEWNTCMMEFIGILRIHDLGKTAPSWRHKIYMIMRWSRGSPKIKTSAVCRLRQNTRFEGIAWGHLHYELSEGSHLGFKKSFYSNIYTMHWRSCRLSLTSLNFYSKLKSSSWKWAWGLKLVVYHVADIDVQSHAVCGCRTTNTKSSKPQRT